MISLEYEDIVALEEKRQNENVELIASENFPSERIKQITGSCLTAKYAEGYPGKRYYGGCQYIDMIETKAIQDVCTLFKCNYANVQPHCGSSANQAVYRALLNKGDTVLGMDLGAGGHLTHGHKMSFSGQDYNIVSYGVDKNGVIDYQDIEDKLYKHNPRMLLVGASSYSQIIDYARIKHILDVYNGSILVELEKEFTGDTLEKAYEESKCYYMVDMAHVAGLVAGGVHPNPCEYADVVTSTTHKTLRGPRGGIILWNSEKLTKAINSAVFPGIQGGPLEHIICAKGICFEEAKSDDFKRYAKQVIDNAKVFANKFIELGWKVISNGTENHMFVLDVYNSIGLTGKQVETILDEVNITLNKNQIPNDELPPLKSSGVRIGTPAMTTKGWKEQDFIDLAILINEILKAYKVNTDNEQDIVNKYKDKVLDLVNKERVYERYNNI